MQKKVLVFGGSGLVGSKFIESYSKDFEIQSPDVSEVDILNKDAILKKLEKVNPDAVINFAAFTNVEEAEKQKDDKNGVCYLINAVGAKNVAQSCTQFGKRLIHISTEYVFDGTKQTGPYTEEDKPNPINWYGQTKYFAETAVLESGSLSVIMRICMPFSAFYELKKDIARFFLEQLNAGNQIKAIEDQRITPILVNDIAAALKVFVDSEIHGIYHVCSKNDTSPFKFAQEIARVFNFNASQVLPISFEEYNKNKNAKLLKYSWLNSSKFSSEFGSQILHSVEESVNIFKEEIDEATNNPI